MIRALLAALLFASALPLGQALAQEKPPNFVLLFADDLGYGDLGCYGNEKIKTPHLDRLAAEGVRFTNFYSCACVCTPSRAGLLTGRYQIRSGLTQVLFPKSQTGIEGEITMAHALKARGYATACIGKWHLGHLPPFLPTRHGFDSYFGIPYSNDMKPTPLMRNEETIEEPAVQTTLTQRYAGEAVKLIHANKAKPFFLYLPFTMPHVPLAASEKFKGKSAAGFYGDVIEELDWAVGEVMGALKAAGVDDNTLVFFTSDNGPWLIKKDHGGTAGKLRNGKGTTFEGGVREPGIVRWPAKIKGGRVEDRPAMTIDLLPTFVALAGGKPPADRPIDGRDLTGVFLGTGKRADEEFFFYRGPNLEAHRSGPWKLKLAGGGNAKAKKKDDDSEVMLFNLDADAGETNNLADKHPEVVARLKARMEEFKKSLGATPKIKT